jgi:hypothetical protein
MRLAGKAICLWLVLAAISLAAQQAPDSLSISTSEVPKARLWEPYRFRFDASGGIEPYQWTVVRGALPQNFRLNEAGELVGRMNELGSFEFILRVKDHSQAEEQTRQYVLSVETPMTADWLRKPLVTGQRVDGSIRVSNYTGRDFDLTFIVLAVNEIQRATAIGYQHFTLKKDAQNVELPFGDTLSPGNYAVNVDVVGEEPVSRQIFRARLVAQNESVTQGP